MKRFPVVAGRFYPGSDSDLESTVETLLHNNPSTIRHNSIGVVSPHAGYIYSGNVCAETLNSIKIPETVILLGPNHHGRGAEIALSTNNWDMVLGEVPIAQDLSELILATDCGVVADEAAHAHEHSLEVQVPFLQILQDKLRIVPISLKSMSYTSCIELAEGLASAIKQYQKPVLLLASSDMSHYESREIATAKDTLALAQIDAMNPSGLYNTVFSNDISMCGIMPVTVTIEASKILGANRSEIIRYTDSGEETGDTSQVVGYAGAVFYKD